MNANSTFSYRISDRLDALDELRRALRGWLGEEAGVNVATAEDVVLAAWEICANAVEHPVRRRGEGVTLTATATPLGVRVAVQDTGSWREEDGPRPGRGLGLRLARATMDRLSILRGRPGTKVVMWRYTGRHA
jgi:anti-sigma regulatory factor (Ser/Thr protein kinase)